MQSLFAGRLTPAVVCFLPARRSLCDGACADEMGVRPLQHKGLGFQRAARRKLACALGLICFDLSLAGCDNFTSSGTETYNEQYVSPSDPSRSAAQSRNLVRKHELLTSTVEGKSFVDLLPLIAVFAALGALWWNAKNNRWKRREYIVNAFQQRWDSPGAKNASFLLYWKERHIPLWADDEEYKWEFVGDHEAAKAILPYRVYPFDFSWAKTRYDWKYAKRRIALTDSFADLIWRLDHVRVISRAASWEDVREVINEMGEIISGDPRAERLAVPGRLLPAAFRLMISWRGMTDLITFFDQHDYDIRYTESDHALLAAAFPDLNWVALNCQGLREQLPARVEPHRRWRDKLGRALQVSRSRLSAYKMQPSLPKGPTGPPPRP